MIKILYVLNDSLHHAGTEAVVLNYWRNIDRKKIHIDFMLHTTEEEIKDNEIAEMLVANNSRIYCVTPRGVNVRKNKKDILSVLEHNHYDVVHSHADCANYIILKYAKEAGVKIRISHSHSTAISIKKYTLKNQLHIMYLNYCKRKIKYVATDLMACSKAAAEWLYQGYADEAIIINNAIDLDRYKFNPEMRKQIRRELKLENRLVLGHIGRFSTQKNHKFLIQIFAEVCERTDNASLLLVGDGEDKEDIINKVSELGLRDKVVFYGSTNQVEKVMQAFDVFVFPSLWEGLSVALIEAQTNGLRCLVSDVDAVSTESSITKNVRRIPLVNPTIWAEEILHGDNARVLDADAIREAGYDIKYEAKKLEKIYLEKCK